MVFVEVAGEDIHGLLALQYVIHHATWIQPEVEYQDGLFRFEHKAAMEDVGQFHFIFPLLQICVGKVTKNIQIMAHFGHK